MNLKNLPRTSVSALLVGVSIFGSVSDARFVSKRGSFNRKSAIGDKRNWNVPKTPGLNTDGNKEIEKRKKEAEAAKKQLEEICKNKNQEKKEKEEKLKNATGDDEKTTIKAEIDKIIDYIRNIATNNSELNNKYKSEYGNKDFVCKIEDGDETNKPVDPKPNDPPSNTNPGNELTDEQKQDIAFMGVFRKLEIACASLNSKKEENKLSDEDFIKYQIRKKLESDENYKNSNDEEKKKKVEEEYNSLKDEDKTKYLSEKGKKQIEIDALDSAISGNFDENDNKYKDLDTDKKSEYKVINGKAKDYERFTTRKYVCRSISEGKSNKDLSKLDDELSSLSDLINTASASCEEFKKKIKTMYNLSTNSSLFSAGGAGLEGIASGLGFSGNTGGTGAKVALSVLGTTTSTVALGTSSAVIHQLGKLYASEGLYWKGKKYESRMYGSFDVSSCHGQLEQLQKKVIELRTDYPAILQADNEYRKKVEDKFGKEGLVYKLDSDIVRNLNCNIRDISKNDFDKLYRLSASSVGMSTIGTAAGAISTISSSVEHVNNKNSKAKLAADISNAIGAGANGITMATSGDAAVTAKRIINTINICINNLNGIKGVNSSTNKNGGGNTNSVGSKLNNTVVTKMNESMLMKKAIQNSSSLVNKISKF